jgi:succinate dehydrogenase/fumarate reductase flavoprotein subunit
MVFNAKTLIRQQVARATVQVYRQSAYITGDGYAIMYQAGVNWERMDFAIFSGVYYPPQMAGYPPNWGGWIERGGLILNKHCERFFKKYLPHRASEVDCLRTEINRAAAWEILEGRGSPHGMVYLNCSNVPKDWMMTARAETFSHFRGGNRPR